MVEPPAAPPLRQPWDVAALLLATSDLLQARFGALSVRGELSGLTRAASGHRYFTLKDLAGGTALLRCAMFRRAGALLDFDARDGQQVELRGRLTVYEPRGELQLVVEAMQRLGAGALYEQFLRLKARLEAEGLFDAARKRPIARWPAALGVVTSTAGAIREAWSSERPHPTDLATLTWPGLSGSDGGDGRYDVRGIGGGQLSVRVGSLDAVGPAPRSRQRWATSTTPRRAGSSAPCTPRFAAVARCCCCTSRRR